MKRQKMKHLKDPRGVALILELVLATVILAVVGFAVYSTLHAKKASISSTPSRSTSPAPSPSPAARQDYLSISQWGVRAPYSGTDKFTYSITTEKWGGVATVVSVRLAGQYPGCATYGAGQIKRMLGTTIASQAMATDSQLTVAQYAQQNPRLGLKQIGDYYYMFMHDQAVCDGGGSATSQNEANNEVQALVAKLEASK